MLDSKKSPQQLDSIPSSTVALPRYFIYNSASCAIDFAELNYISPAKPLPIDGVAMEYGLRKFGADKEGSSPNPVIVTFFPMAASLAR